MGQAKESSVEKYLDFTLDLQINGEEVDSLKLRPMAPITLFELDGRKLSFDVGNLTHSYLSLEGCKSFSIAPEKSHIPVKANTCYGISGKVLSKGGDNHLWIIEFDEDGERLGHEHLPLRTGFFQRYWQTDKKCKKVILALRLTGKGFLQLPSLQLTEVQELPENVDVYKPSFSQRLSSSVSKIAPHSLLVKAQEQDISKELQENYNFDLEHFEKFAKESSEPRERLKIEREISEIYQKIEQSLAFRDVQPRYGKAAAHQLADVLEHYIKKFGFNEIATTSLRCLKSYIECNDKHLIKDKKLKLDFQNLLHSAPETLHSLVSDKPLFRTRDEITEATNIDFQSFVSTNHSVRDFDGSSVSVEKIKEALDIAKRTPSATDRQAWRVHLFDGKQMNAILALNRKHHSKPQLADKLILLTGDTRLYFGAAERNQLFTDVGIFSNLLTLSLHNMGIGTYAVPLATGEREERIIKETATIPESERLVVMLALGNLPERINVSTSPRIEIEEFFTNHSSKK